MFLLKQKKEDIKKYEEYLKIVGSLSKLFSDSTTPYLYYRVAEKIFCRSFFAEDLSRSDVSADAKKGSIGIGLKTFLIGNNKTFQKVAEFNSDRPLYSDLSAKELIKKVGYLRNKRISFTENAYGINSSIYHCVIREAGKFKIFEEPMDKVDINNIRDVKVNRNSILFNDGLHDYSFLLSKSTLQKRFQTTKTCHEFKVKILNDPISQLKKLFSNDSLIYDNEIPANKVVYLPLYGRNQEVFPRSGLNQWNANGRKRDINEAYIPIPKLIHDVYPDFFPDRDTPFKLKLPNGAIMRSKVCQDGGKALMSYSNKQLGQWILRDVLNLKEGELLSYNKLMEIGVDSVRIDKVDDTEFEINFSKIGSYENFKTTIS